VLVDRCSGKSYIFSEEGLNSKCNVKGKVYHYSGLFRVLGGRLMMVMAMASLAWTSVGDYDVYSLLLV
jgi:hypothetical protein